MIFKNVYIRKQDGVCAAALLPRRQRRLLHIFAELPTKFHIDPMFPVATKPRPNRLDNSFHWKLFQPQSSYPVKPHCFRGQQCPAPNRLGKWFPLETIPISLTKKIISTGKYFRHHRCPREAAMFPRATMTISHAKKILSMDTISATIIVPGGAAMFPRATMPRPQLLGKLFPVETMPCPQQLGK